MKTKNIISLKKKAQKQVPVFEITDRDCRNSADALAPESDTISFFDIKELYDRAYAAKEQGRDDEEVQKLMCEAIKMDMAYRAHLSPHRTAPTMPKPRDLKVVSEAV